MTEQETRDTRRGSADPLLEAILKTRSRRLACDAGRSGASLVGHMPKGMLPPRSFHPYPMRRAMLGPGFLGWLQVFLMNLVSNGDLEFEISLQVRGALVTGRLISLRDYAGRFAEKFATGFRLPPHVAKSIRADMRLLFGLDDGQLERATRDLAAARYIHLKDARVLSG